MGYSLRFAQRHGRARCGRPLATVLGQEGDEAVHRLEASRVDHRAPVAAHGDQPSDAETVEMERERVGGESELLRDPSSGHTLRPCFYEQAEDIEAIFLRERSEGRDGLHRFHVSTIIEMLG